MRKGKTLSNYKRNCLCSDFKDNQPTVLLAKKYKIDVRTVQRLRKQYLKEGDCLRKKRGPKPGNGKISREALQADLDEHRFDSVAKRAKRLEVSDVAIYKALKRMKIKPKKLKMESGLWGAYKYRATLSARR